MPISVFSTGVRGLTGIDFVGFDVVEVIPGYDPGGVTATLAAESQVPHRQANDLYCRGLLEKAPHRLMAAAARFEDASRPPSKLAQLRHVRTQDHRSFGKDARASRHKLAETPAAQHRAGSGL